MVLAHNAVIYLFQRAWTHSDKKYKVVLYTFLQLVASVISLFEPWPLAKSINSLASLFVGKILTMNDILWF